MIRKGLGKLIEMYSRQVLIKEIGVKGLAKLRRSRVAIIGCGATGSTAAELLARAGVGFLRVIDRDFVDISNIPRTHLLTEDDAEKSMPKAIACTTNLKRISSLTKVEPAITDVNPNNIEELIADVDIVIDGLDNFTTRYLINDAAIKLRKPWVYIGVERWFGNVMLIIPGKTACLRCLIVEPPPEVGNVCEILGVVNTTVNMAVSIAVTEVLKYLLGLKTGGELIVIDSLRYTIDKIKMVRNPKCPACSLMNLEFLNQRNKQFKAKRICGTNAVQVYPDDKVEVNTEKLTDIKISSGSVLLATPYIAKIKVNNYEVVLFRDGRAIINELIDEKLAMEIYKKIMDEISEYVKIKGPK